MSDDSEVAHYYRLVMPGMLPLAVWDALGITQLLLGAVSRLEPSKDHATLLRASLPLHYNRPSGWTSSVVDPAKSQERASRWWTYA